MAPPFDWSVENTKLLISLYEENDLLYDNLHPHYKDRNKRLATLVKIAEILTVTVGKVCVVADVRKKINCLRSQYLAEKLKVTKTKSGSSGDVYQPSAYWYPMLHFLNKSTNADSSTSNFDDVSDETGSHRQTTSTNAGNQSNSMDDSGNNSQAQSTDTEELIETKFRKKRQLAQTSHTSNDDKLIHEAISTMRDMSQMAMKKPTLNKNINSFCQFIESELNDILSAGNVIHVKKAKRQIQQVLFQIWDEVDNAQSRPSTSWSNASFSSEPMLAAGCAEEEGNNSTLSQIQHIEPNTTGLTNDSRTLNIDSIDAACSVQLQNNIMARSELQEEVFMSTDDNGMIAIDATPRVIVQDVKTYYENSDWSY